MTTSARPTRPDRPARRAAARAPLPALLGLVALLAGCATPLPDSRPPAAPAPQWQARLPHGGDAAALAGWWQRFDDPLLPALIADAQAASPELAQALARVRQGRAALQGAEGARWPGAQASARASRASDSSTSFAAVSQASSSLDAQWEIDLFGGVRHEITAARARAGQAELGWHEARVTLAADVARSYLALRACEAVLVVYEDSARSQELTASLTREKLRVGFEAPADAALADATAAQARDRRTAQQADCDVQVKSLVALTGQDEPSLRQRLAGRRAQLPQAAGFALAPLPAEVLAQRPDIAAAERALVASAADVGVADANRWPRLTLGGGLGVGVLRVGGDTRDAVTWSFGPSLTVPLFDGGRRAAQLDAARARHDEARAALDERLRASVREIEQALVQVVAAQERLADAEVAARGFRQFFEAAETRWRVGAGSLIDMEEARRSALNAQAGLIGVQQERAEAWVRLYRAAGGGWRAGDPLPDEAVAGGSMPTAPLPATAPAVSTVSAAPARNDAALPPAAR